MPQSPGLRIGFRNTVLVIAAALLPLQNAAACTSFVLASADGGKIYGRTMEFGLDLASEIIVVPRKLVITGTGPDGTAASGLAWTTKYAVAGANGLGLPIVVDGVNEAGLAGGLLYLPNVAVYQDVAPGDARSSIASYELLLYTLTSFATVAEARAGIEKIKVNRAPQAVFKMAVPVHMTLHDASGANIVVEYVDGVLHIYDNPTSIMTNAPTFDWHITNLNNYLGLSVTDPAPRKIGGIELAPPSTGTGMLGIPGDMSSPSRFVRAFVYAHAAPEAKTSDQAVLTAFHLLNNFDIAPGTIRTEAGSKAGGGVAAIETTQWMSVSDLKQKKFYIRTYDGYDTQVVDLKAAKLDAPGIVLLPLHNPGAPKNVTP
nr:choloylglycine hydrolase family protein [uncultured Rhodopila sp.]